MLFTQEYELELLYHPLVPVGFIPPIEDPEGIYPYESYGETSRRPVVRKFRFVSMENEFIRVVVCPDLGGKVDSIYDKSAQKEMLHRPDSVRAARILPRMAFISGGIELSFPISHTPVQIETVHHATGRSGNRVYIWCGERELRYGMQWTVEYSLGEEDRFLTQRTLFRNPTAKTHSWMSWSNAAVEAEEDTEFHFPGGNVLVHGDTLGHLDWESEGPRSMGGLDRMTGYFWENPEYNAFGAFTPSTGRGLYHVADRNQTPGMKLWVYGTGRHEKWAWLSGMRKKSYLEIQAGPLKDQSIKHFLAPGDQRSHTEFWIPSTVPMDISRLEVPAVELVGEESIPLFDWVERPSSAAWLRLMHAYREKNPGLIPLPPEWYRNEWPPSGMEDLAGAIRWAMENSGADDVETWGYHLAVWFAGCDRREDALSAVAKVPSDWARVLEARLLRCWKGDHAGAAAALSRIRSDTVALHPQVVMERDLALASLGVSALSERLDWLRQVDALEDDVLIERFASCLLDAGEAGEAKTLLESRTFEPVHQRYERTLLWQRIHGHTPEAIPPVPEQLGEDDLAAFGLYRTTDPGPPGKS